MVAIHHPSRSLGVIKIERAVALFFAGLEIIIHGGAIWGWPSYVYILKQDGFFSHLCHTDVGPDGGATHPINGSYQALADLISHNDFTGNSENSSSEFVTVLLEDGVPSPTSIPGDGRDVLSCDDQDAMIQLVFTVAMGTYLVCSCWLTNIIDRFGIRFARIFVFIGCLVSYILLAVATPETSLILFPAMTILTSCGSVLLTVNLQAGNLFGRGKATVMSWLNGCLSASVIVFYMIKVAHESGIPARYSFYFLAGSTSLMLINTIMLPKKRIPWPLPEGYRLVSCGKSSSSSSSSSDAEVNQSRESKPLRGDCDRGDDESLVERRCHEKEIKKQTHFHDIQELGETLKRHKYPNFRSCVFSPLFWLVVLWFGVLQLNITFLFGAFNSIISRHAGGNLSIVSRYTDVFLLLQIVPVLLSQLLGLLMDRNKLKLCRKNNGTKRGPYDDLKDTCLPLALTTIVSIGYSAFLTVPSLHVQYVTFTLVLIVMSVLWGYLSAIVAIIFPMKIFSTLIGSFKSIGGIVTFLQFPLFRTIQNNLHNDPFYVIMCLIVADITTFALPIYIWYFVKKQYNIGHVSVVKPVNV